MGCFYCVRLKICPFNPCKQPYEVGTVSLLHWKGVETEAQRLGANSARAVQLTSGRAGVWNSENVPPEPVPLHRVLASKRAITTRAPRAPEAPRGAVASSPWRVEHEAPFFAGGRGLDVSSPLAPSRVTLLSF